MTELFDETMLTEAVQRTESTVFLLTGEEPNLMTIGWCQWGRVWNRMVCTIFVRKSRLSYELLASGRFTVSVPAPGVYKEALAYCGSHSGRDGNKIKALGLETLPSRTGGVPALKGCQMHFECKELCRIDGDFSSLEKPLYDQFYDPQKMKREDGDPHCLIFGEILAAYRE